MRKSFLSVACAVAAVTVLYSCKSAKTNNKDHLFALVGTYTAGDSSHGIYVYDFDQEKGTLKEVSHTDSSFNPSYLALAKDEKYLYAVNENTDTTTKGMVSAFSFNKDNGSLGFLNEVPSNGDAPCFVAIDRNGKNVAVANYNGADFSVYKTDTSGRLLPASQIITHTGTSTNKKIQTQSHVHSTFFSPDGNYLFVCDLGNDTLYQYPFDASAAKPVDPLHVRTYKVPGGFGPRHLAFTPNGKFAYLLNELDAKIIAYRLNNDSLASLQTVVSTNVEDTANADKGSAAIRITPDGKFLYASNRGNANDIAIFRIGTDGTLSAVAHMKTDKHPRDFNISPNGKYLIVASRDDNSVKVYVIDQQTGLLTYNGQSISIPKPVVVIFGAKN